MNYKDAFVYVIANGKDLTSAHELPVEHKYRKQLKKLGYEKIQFFRGAQAGRFRFFTLDILKMLHAWLLLKSEGNVNRPTFYFDGLEFYKDREKAFGVAYEVLEYEGRCKDTEEIASEIAMNERENLWRGYEPDKE